eukprot:3940745-Rhodomonas_salina.28
MSGTDVANGAIELCACHTMPVDFEVVSTGPYAGTLSTFARAMRYPLLTYRPVLSAYAPGTDLAIGPRTCYVMSGTDLAYGAVTVRWRGPVHGLAPSKLLPYGLRACYRMPVTDLAYAATRSLHSEVQRRGG